MEQRQVMAGQVVEPDRYAVHAVRPKNHRVITGRFSAVAYDFVQSCPID